MEIYDMSFAQQPVIAARLSEKMGVTGPTAWNTVHRMRDAGLVDIDDHSKQMAHFRPRGRKPLSPSNAGIC